TVLAEVHEDGGKRNDLGTVWQILHLENLLPVQEARGPHEACLNAVRPRLPVGDLKLQDVFALATDARHLVGCHAVGKSVASTPLRDEQRDGLEEIVTLEVSQNRVLFLQSLFTGVPIVAKSE